jgi:4-amino-4-deoxy-L-arabinose transferase-like glycosyltransferase
MFVILPFIALVLLFKFWHNPYQDWRRAVLLAALSWGVFIVLIIEGLSVTQSLNLVGLSVLWLIVDVVLIVAIRRQSRQARSTLSADDGLSTVNKPLTLYLKLLLAGVVVIVISIGLIGLVAPPNNWDSMTYHMGRVVHWVQSRNVDHYPTSIIRQLYPGPWSSFAITHLQILSGSDRFANLIQWLSMIGSLVGVSLIAQQLGARLHGQIFATVVCATIPMGILQASSTQNDYVVALWLVCLAYCVLQAIQSKFEGLWVYAAGASLGLAILTKGTAYLYAFPFCLWLLFSSLRRLQERWKSMLGFGAIALALNIIHYWRNWQVFDSFLGESGQGLEIFNLSVFLSNILRNLALHLSTPVRSINLVTIQAVEALHRLIGIDASDPRITSPPGYHFDMHSLINHEDLAGNPLHLFLFLAVTIAFFVTKNPLKRRQRYFLAAYWLAVLAGFLLFCALIIWSPWRSRLHLPIFVLAAPFIGSIFSEVLSRRLVNLVVAALLGASFIWVGFNETRPLILNSQIVETRQVYNIFNQSRTDQYFATRPDLQENYVKIAEFVKSQTCTQLGLKLGKGDLWEYPLWVLLNNHANPSLRIEHIDVANASATQAQVSSYRPFLPCAVVAIGHEAATQDEIYAYQTIYQRQWNEGNFSVFVNQQISDRREQ